MIYLVIVAEYAAEKQRRRGPGRPFRPGQSGNPSGKRKGARHRATILAEQLLDGEAEGLIRQVIQKAKQGDMIALKLCLDRILPPRRDRAVCFASGSDRCHQRLGAYNVHDARQIIGED
jgi:Family of unknown function (DUF5681)